MPPPAARSGSRRGRTSRSTRRIPSAIQRRQHACAPGSCRAEFQQSPVSNTSTCACVAINTAEPRPASSTLDAHGAEFRQARRHEDQRQQHAPRRSAAAPAASATTTPGPLAMASMNHHADGVTRQLADSRSAAQTRPGQSHSYSAAAAPNGRPSSAGNHQASSAPASTSGTNTNEMSGIASRLTPKPTSDTPPNTAKVERRERQHDGELQLECPRRACRGRTSALPSSSRITPTATNDSQKPAASGASGSSSSTATSASDQVRAGVQRARAQPCPGEYRQHQPGALRGHRESGEQRVATPRPPALTTTRKARARASVPWACSATAARAQPKASMANSVTCRPEIATRCVVPVALNTRHWSGSCHR